MRADRHLMPAAQADAEALRYALPQFLGQTPLGGAVEIDMGVIARDLVATAKAAQTVKLSPQPQAPLALGLVNTKPAVKSSSTQSMVDPIRYRTDAPSM